MLWLRLGLGLGLVPDAYYVDLIYSQHSTASYTPDQHNFGHVTTGHQHHRQSQCIVLGSNRVTEGR